jgi:hypothetical protein
MIRRSLIALLFGTGLLLAGPTGFGPAATLAQGCMSQNEVRAAVASGQAAPFSNFVGGLRSMGDVVSSCLAKRNGGYAYVASIVQSNGQVTQIVLDARSGRRLN